MVIISTVSHEPTSSKVIDWLGWLGQRFVRLNMDRLQIDVFAALLKQRISSLWWRKGAGLFSIDSSLYDQVPEEFTDWSGSELSYLAAGIFSTSPEYVLGRNPADNFVCNKFYVLEKFKQFGLLVPPTIVTASKADLLQFIAQHGGVITKPIGDGRSFEIDSRLFRIYTEEIARIVPNLPSEFFPSLFQKKIVKQYEVRSVFICGKIYSIASFSKSVESKDVDTRKQAQLVPPRKTLFQIPSSIEDKMRLLMEDLKLDIGVFDIIIDVDGNFIFLEINPWGQFSDVSIIGNMYLEREIAQLLSHNQPNHEKR